MDLFWFFEGRVSPPIFGHTFLYTLDALTTILLGFIIAAVICYAYIYRGNDIHWPFALKALAAGSIVVFIWWQFCMDPRLIANIGIALILYYLVFLVVCFLRLCYHYLTSRK